MVPELRVLRYFVAVAEELHFGRAAERVLVTQPALSRQIAELEEQLGVSLLIRTSRSVRLTDAGAALLVEARRALAQAERAAETARRAGRGEVGRVRVGFRPGASWCHAWASLRLFSPAQWSSLPGWSMPPSVEGTPSRDDVIAYFAAYEGRYQLPVERPVRVTEVRRAGERLRVETNRGDHLARAVVSATGTWGKPLIPDYPGRERFRGVQLHSAEYRSPEPFRDQVVLVVGGGNSGAQIMAEVSQVAEAFWVTLREPRFLPDDVDGRVLFQRATERFLAGQAGRPIVEEPGSLGDIVMMPPVREARARGALDSVRPFVQFTEDGVLWPEGHAMRVDAVIWCTGFGYALDHLAPLGIIEPDGRVAVQSARVLREPRLWLLGYGEWTGEASATIIGVGRYARSTVAEVAAALSS